MIFQRTTLACLVVGCAAAAMIGLLATPLIRLMFGGGQFDEQSTKITADLLICLVWSLPGSIVLWAVNMPLIAVARSHVPAAIYIGGYVLQIVFMAALFPVLGKYALVWGYTLSSGSQAVFGWWVVRRALVVPPTTIPQATVPLKLAVQREREAA